MFCFSLSFGIGIWVWIWNMEYEIGLLCYNNCDFFFEIIILRIIDWLGEGGGY